MRSLTHEPVTSTITWGLCRSVGEPESRTVFCYACKEVFARGLTCPAETLDCKRKAEQTHVCGGDK